MRRKRYKHEHLPPCETCGKPLIRVTRRGWSVVVHDDGSFCTKIVKPVPHVFEPEKVLAFFMSGVDTR